MEVKVQRLDHYGRGIAKIDDKVVFIENALPNELVDINIVKEKRTSMEAKSTKIIKASSVRRDALCPFYDQCGGCTIMHIDYPEQLLFKKKKVIEILKKFADINLEDVPIIPSEEYYYRNKVTFHIEKDKMGFYQKGSNQLVPISHCLLLNEDILKIHKRLLSFIKKETKCKEAIIKTGTGHLLHLKGNVDEEKTIEYFKDIVSTILLNDEVIYGTGSIAKILFTKHFDVHDRSFFQVNDECTKNLYGLIIEKVKEIKPSKVCDLYSGTGTISIILSDYVKEVTGIEIIKEAIENANNNKKFNHVENVNFIEGKVEDHLSELANDYDLLIVDPPRKGLEENVVNCILENKIKHMIYISCDPITLARDLKSLKEIYRVNKVELIDMFPNTHHVETVITLTLKD